MKTVFIAGAMLAFCSCTQHPRTAPVTVSLSYRQTDIQQQFDTLFNHQQTAAGVYKGFIEQALAICHGDTGTVTQDVLSSMYLNRHTGRYDCVTTTVFQFPDGTIAANGLFNLTPGDTIAPDHDFPITGGSGAYHDIAGTYTRRYREGVYHVELRYYKLR